MKNSYQPLIVALFLGIASLLTGFWHAPTANTIQVRAAVAQNNLSVPSVFLKIAQGAELSNVADQVDAPASSQVASNQSFADANTAIEDPGQPIGQTFNPAQGISYIVKKGDTLSSIASYFNVSVTTILSANPNISKKFVRIGASIIIPGTSTGDATSSLSSLPNYNGEFIIPAQGNNLGILDSNNGVGIVNSCGTPVVASADGIVVPDPNILSVAGGWNDGYGNFVLIEHGFGNDIFTRYAHLQQASVQIGDYVRQGQQIGLLGESGGVANCELGFEVIGAQNPFASSRNL